MAVPAAPSAKLKSAAARPDVLKIDLGLSDDQGVIAARLSLKKDAPYGPLAGEVRLEFTGPQDYILTVPFSGYVAEP